jgi:hypothetical protein
VGPQNGSYVPKNFKTGATTFASYRLHNIADAQGKNAQPLKKKEVKLVATKQTRWCLNNICTACFETEKISTTKEA